MARKKPKGSCSGSCGSSSGSGCGSGHGNSGLSHGGGDCDCGGDCDGDCKCDADKKKKKIMDKAQRRKDCETEYFLAGLSGMDIASLKKILIRDYNIDPDLLKGLKKMDLIELVLDLQDRYV